MLGEEAVAQPVVKRLAGKAGFGEQAREFRGGPVATEGVGEKRVQALLGGRLPL